MGAVKEEPAKDEAPKEEITPSAPIANEAEAPKEEAPEEESSKEDPVTTAQVVVMFDACPSSFRMHMPPPLLSQVRSLLRKRALLQKWREANSPAPIASCCNAESVLEEDKVK